MPAAHEVKIVVDGVTNKLRYFHKKGTAPDVEESSFHVDPADTVVWYSEDEKLGIHFENNHTPFVNEIFATSAEKSTSAAGGKKPTPLLTVRSHVNTTRYKYFVASAKSSGTKHMVTDDPDIIVDGTGGGGGGVLP